MDNGYIKSDGKVLDEWKVDKYSYRLVHHGKGSIHLETLTDGAWKSEPSYYQWRVVMARLLELKYHKTMRVDLNREEINLLNEMFDYIEDGGEYFTEDNAETLESLHTKVNLAEKNL